MVRRLISTAALVACVTAPVWAAEQATVVLKDGSRASGAVVFHGSNNRNIIDNFINLGQQGGREKTIPMDQVALIEFGGGEPTAAEFRQLPGDQGHLIVLRNGTMQRGKLIDLVNGDTVQWQNEAGQSQQYAIRDVSRVYVSSQGARQVFPHLASTVSSQVTPEGNNPDGEGQAVPRGAIRVTADEQWVRTGVRVMKGRRVAFSATGQVQFSGDRAHTAGPDGNPSVPNSNLPVSAMSVGGLIGKVGNSEPFPIGSNRQPIVMPESGELLLGVNDTDVNDNRGFFSVNVTNGGR